MPSRRPEILAPAGDLESLQAALASGVDAVYFGLDEGFNARADNFSLARLPETMALVHRAGARAYLTLASRYTAIDASIGGPPLHLGSTFLLGLATLGSHVHG